MDELRTGLQAGQSLAEASGVERQALVDALLADVAEHLAEEVAEGDLSQAEADERKAEAIERIEEKVDRAGLPSRGDRAPAPDDVAAEPATS